MNIMMVYQKYHYLWQQQKVCKHQKKQNNMNQELELNPNRVIAFLNKPCN